MGIKASSTPCVSSPSATAAHQINAPGRRPGPPSVRSARILGRCAGQGGGRLSSASTVNQGRGQRRHFYFPVLLVGNGVG